MVLRVLVDVLVDVHFGFKDLDLAVHFLGCMCHPPTRHPPYSPTPPLLTYTHPYSPTHTLTHLHYYTTLHCPPLPSPPLPAPAPQAGAPAEQLLDLDVVLGPAALYAGQSMLMFGFGSVVVEVRHGLTCLLHGSDSYDCCPALAPAHPPSTRPLHVPPLKHAHCSLHVPHLLPRFHQRLGEW